MVRGLLESPEREPQDAGRSGEPTSAARDGAARPGGAAPRAGPLRLGTRRRLVLAFTALAAAFAATFGSLLLGLARMDEQLAYLHEHEHQMQVALDVQAAIRGLYLPDAPEDAAPRPRADARRRLFAEIALLTEQVDEPEAIAWVARIAAAARELDAPAGGDVSPAGLAADSSPRREARTYRLLLEVEENAGNFFAFLRDRVAERSGTVGALQRRTLQLSIAFVIGTLLLAGVLAVHLSRSIAAPLAVIGAGAARIAAGDLDTRVRVARSDEFGVLAAELNSMAASLQLHQEKLVRSEKLAGLGRVAAGIAHELNNPLQVMLGYVSLDRDKVKGEVAQHLARIEREALRCKEIVEGLLQLSRPAVAFTPEDVDLRGVCEEVAEAIRIELRDRAPAIVVDGSASALGTRCRLRQVVFNLARNAADAAGPAGTVRIALRAGRDAAEVVVSDDGPGIAPEVRDRIFEPFFTTKATGTGLGLAIARAIAASLGGELELDARAARGAQFTVRLPRARGTPRANLPEGA